MYIASQLPRCMLRAALTCTLWENHPDSNYFVFRPLPFIHVSHTDVHNATFLYRMTYIPLHRWVWLYLNHPIFFLQKVGSLVVFINDETLERFYEPWLIRLAKQFFGFAIILYLLKSIFLLITALMEA